MSNEITGFTIEDVQISWDDDFKMAYIDQDECQVEINKESMTKIAIQWLCLHAPEVIKED